MLNIANCVVAVASDAYVAGRDAEEGHEIIAEAYYVTVTEPDGTRYRHDHSFKTMIFQKFWDNEEKVEYSAWMNEADEAERKAALLVSRIEQAGFINLNNWRLMESEYGSAAYCRNGEERDQILRERAAG